MANSGDPDEMQHNYAVHLGLHCLLRLHVRRSSEKEMQFYLEIITCHPSIYTMNQPKLICTISDGRAHQHTCVSIDWWTGLKHGMFSAPYLHQGETLPSSLLCCTRKTKDSSACAPTQSDKRLCFFGTCKVYCSSLLRSFRYSSYSVVELAG